MTEEEEARTKWCPMANIAAIGSFGYNRDTVGDPAWRSFCIASDCMMWRWSDAENSYQNDDGSWVGMIPKHGYCGLGGKP